MMYRDNNRGRRKASTAFFRTPLQSVLMKTTPKTNYSANLSAGLLIWLAAVNAAFGQVTQFTDNFNSSNDVGWVHYDPLQPPPFNAFASWTFPPDGSGGFAYRLLGGPPQ